MNSAEATGAILTAGTMRGPTRAARGSIFPRKAACQGKAPTSAEARASRVPWAGGDRTPSAGRTLTSPTSALRSSNSWARRRALAMTGPGRVRGSPATVRPKRAGITKPHYTPSRGF